MFGLAAVSCTIDPDATPNTPDIAVESSDSTTQGGDVRSSDGTQDSEGTSAGNQAGGGDTTGVTGSAGTAGTGADSGAATEGGGSQGSAGGTDTGTNTAMTTTTDTTSDTTTECAKVEANFTAVIPSIYVLVDRSGSMARAVDGTERPPAGQSRWEIVERTLVEEGAAADPDSGGVVYRMQSKAKFALATYTATGSTCPAMAYSESGAADELPKINNWEGVRDQLADGGPGGTTPSSEAIDWVWQKIKANNDPNRILVFASDGDPWYSGDQCIDYPFPDSVTATDNYARVVEVVREMHKEKIKTFVISVGAQTSVPGMDAVARAGVGVTSGMSPGDAGYPDNPNEGGSQTDRYFFSGTSSNLIEQAFESVITGARPCKFELEGKLNDQATSGEVKINGELKTFNDPDGWRINSPTEIELLGASCTQVRSDPDVELKVSFSCGVFQPG